MRDAHVVTGHIKKRYASIARTQSSAGCCHGYSCCTDAPQDIGRISSLLGYGENGSDDENLGLGCGNPLVFASLQEGETVLDLGSGGGFDCFLARRQVGESGRVVGVDMTSEMVRLARSNCLKLGYANVDFIEGNIEALPIEDDSIDVIISNCVINLSRDKRKVFQEAYRVLKPGGRLAVADVVATAEIPEEIRRDLDMFTGCIAGAEQVTVIEQLLRTAGFSSIVLEPKDTSREILSTWVPGSNLDRYVASYMIEAVKPQR